MTDYRCHRGAHCVAAERVTTVLCEGDCDCHTGPYTACSIPGGCGSLHVDSTAQMGAGTELAHTLCTRCARIVSAAIADLPADYVGLCLARGHGMSPSWGDLVSSSRDLPVPISLTFDTLAAQMVDETTAFVEPVAEKLGIDWDTRRVPKKRTSQGDPPRYREAVVFHTAARLLARSTTVLLALPPWEYQLWHDGQVIEFEADGLTVALALLALHRAARVALGLTRVTTALVTPCPLCNAQAMVREIGSDGVYCTRCEVRWTELDYQRLTLVLAAEHRGVIPKPVRISDPHPSSVEGNAGQLVAHAHALPAPLPYRLPMVR